MVMAQELLGLEPPFLYQNVHKTVLYKRGRGFEIIRARFQGEKLTNAIFDVENVDFRVILSRP